MNRRKTTNEGKSWCFVMDIYLINAFIKNVSHRRRKQVTAYTFKPNRKVYYSFLQQSQQREIQIYTLGHALKATPRGTW